MVLFDNIKIGQKVEVRWRGRIVPGTIKYKGSMNGVRGEWVGVALDYTVGLHDGMVKGRRYFLCDQNHGIFTLASQIRFVALKRCLYNNYRTVDRDSIIEQELFGSCSAEPQKSGFVVEGHAEKLCTPRYGESAVATPRKKDISLRHSASGRLAPTNWLKPETARSIYCSYKSKPYHTEYDNDADDFIRSSSIPIIHMPHAALKEQVKRGWDHAPMVRHWTVHTGKEAIKYNQWNDISA